jgi:flagellar biosynthesis/type III secretory pathway protein FliH
MGIPEEWYTYVDTEPEELGVSDLAKAYAAATVKFGPTDFRTLAFLEELQNLETEISESENAYDEGYEEGYAVGHDDGFEEGASDRTVDPIDPEDLQTYFDETKGEEDR